jgi:type II secretory pathway pseudopilin PulG
MPIFAGRLSRKNFALGFLLLLIVPAVLGIFAAILLVSLSSARQKARDANAQAQMQEQEMNQIVDQSQTTQP